MTRRQTLMRFVYLTNSENEEDTAILNGYDIEIDNGKDQKVFHYGVFALY